MASTTTGAAVLATGLAGTTRGTSRAASIALAASRLASLRRIAACVAVVLSCLGVAAGPAGAAPGALDATFGGGAGTVITDVGPTIPDAPAPPVIGGAQGVAVQQDGKILAVGPDSKLVRYDRDGTLDSTWGGDGRLDTVIQGRAVAVQPDGKIVIAGDVPGRPAPDEQVGTPSDFAVVRYHPDGGLDMSFGDGGKAVTEFLISSPGLSQRTRSTARRVTIQRDGKIVLAGEINQGSLASPNTAVRTLGVARYTTDGSADRTFSADGKSNVTIDERSSGVGLALQDDGKIVLATGRGRPSAFFVARLLSSGPSAGALDPSFGAAGSVSTAFPGAAFAAATDVITQGDRIVAVGAVADGPLFEQTGPSADFALARYREDGSLDPGFGGDGRVTTDLGGQDLANAIAVQDDGQGKLVAAGRTFAPSGVNPPADFALARYRQDGALDVSFGAGGKVTTPFGPRSNDLAYGLAIQPDDGRIVAVGGTFDGRVGSGFGNEDFALARYDAAISADLSLAGTATPSPAAVGGSLTYTLTATNRGPDSARDVRLSDALSTRVSYESSSTTQGSCVPSGDRRSLSCALGNIASGASVTVRIVVAAIQTGTATNSASVTNSREDPDDANNSVTVNATITAPGTPPVVPPPTLVVTPGPVASGAKATAKMEVVRSVVSRSSRRLDVLAPISRLASGSVRVEFFAAGRRVRFSVPVDAKNGRVRFSHSIPKAQADLGTGILTLSYPGDGDTRPQQVRLRAASRHANLRLERPQITGGGRLRAAGTVSRRAGGLVRVQVEYVVDGRTNALAVAAPIRNGRWTLDEALSKTVRDAIARRTGTVHSYTLFTGYLPPRMRGEMRSLQILGER